tara:strand:+ start:49879 stop:50133 length:255 start_codon:yes stop_codon:yes gene_type:complete
MKDLDILESKLKTIISLVETHIENKTKKIEDMGLILNMLEIHIRDLEFIKYNLKNNDYISIEDFKDILLNINKFTNESHELLKK